MVSPESGRQRRDGRVGAGEGDAQGPAVGRGVPRAGEADVGGQRARPESSQSNLESGAGRVGEIDVERVL